MCPRTLSTRDSLLLKLGAARQQAPRAWRLVEVEVPSEGFKLSYRLRKEALRRARRREGHHLLRTNLSQRQPSQIWEFYTLLTQIEEAFKNLKGDLAIRPIFHKKEPRIEAHILVPFLAYCLHGLLLVCNLFSIGTELGGVIPAVDLLIEQGRIVSRAPIAIRLPEQFVVSTAYPLR